MYKHRAILFAEDVAADFDDQVWTDSKDLAVECCMVQRAQRQTIRDHRNSAWMAIGQNMRRVQQFAMAQATNAAGFAVGEQYTLAKGLLV